MLRIELKVGRMAVMITAFVVLAVFTEAAHAAFISDVFKPSSTDASVRLLLRPLFGGLVDQAMGDGGSGDSTALMNIIKFSLVNIIVPVGGLLLLVSTYMGISSAAITAEMYGNKNAAYWVAVRTVIGFGMIAPAPGLKGLALVNLLLMWLTLHGVGGGSSEWGVVVDEITKNPVILANNAPPTKLFDAMLRGEICAAIYNNVSTEAGENDVPADQLKVLSKLSSGSTDKLGWIKPGGPKTNDGGCGTITIERDANVGTVDMLVPLGSIKSIDTASLQVQTAMQGQTDTTLDALHVRAHEVAQMIIDYSNVPGADLPPVESYFNLMEWFKAQQQKAAQNIATTAMTDVSAAFKTAAKQEGWVTAGFYFLGLSSFQQVVNRAIAMDWITAEEASWEDVKGRIADDGYLSRSKNQWDYMEGYINAGHQQVKAGHILPAAVTKMTINPMKWAPMEWAGKGINDRLVQSINSNATPLGAAADIGSSLITIGYGIMAGGGAVNFATSSLPNWMGGSKVKEWAGTIFMVGVFIWLGGLVLMLICLLPALAWGRRVLAWVVRAAVAQFAGPAWMVLHIHHAGEGMTGSASSGYMLALQLVLTPMLDITALAIIYELMIVTPPFMNATIMPVIMAMGSGTLTFFAVFLTAIVNAGLIFALVALLERFDHEVMAFIGGRGSDLSLDHDGDKNRMMALMAFTNRKMPGLNIPKGNKDGGDDTGGATLGGASGQHHKGWANLRGGKNITNDHLLPKDK